MNLKTTNIKGKEYVEVNTRVAYFRTSPEYKGWSLTTEIVALDDAQCVMKAVITNADGVVVATGYAQEDRSSSYINKTSYVENCETSAWGRCLGNLGIGIETSIASSEEVSMAIAKQDAESSVFDQAVAHLSSKSPQERPIVLASILKKHGKTFTAAQKKKLEAI